MVANPPLEKVGFVNMKSLWFVEHTWWMWLCKFGVTSRVTSLHNSGERNLRFGMPFWRRDELGRILEKKQKVQIKVLGCLLGNVRGVLRKSSLKSGRCCSEAEFLCWGWYCPQQHWEQVGWVHMPQWLLGVGQYQGAFLTWWLELWQQWRCLWHKASGTPIGNTALVWLDCFGKLKGCAEFCIQVDIGKRNSTQELEDKETADTWVAPVFKTLLML